MSSYRWVSAFRYWQLRRLLEQGARLEEVLAAADEIRSRIRVIAMLNTLEYARRSGRLSWAQASVGQVLQLKPFITLRNGVLTRHGEARSRQKGIQRLYKFLCRPRTPGATGYLALKS